VKVEKAASAGSLESSDALVTVQPGAKGIEIALEGATAARFAPQIEETIRSALEQLGVESCAVRVQDKGALDCTIKARLCAAVARAAAAESVDWEALK